jgi:hypothetical protein
LALKRAVDALLIIDSIISNVSDLEPAAWLKALLKASLAVKTTLFLATQSLQCQIRIVSFCGFYLS